MAHKILGGITESGVLDLFDVWTSGGLDGLFDDMVLLWHVLGEDDDEVLVTVAFLAPKDVAQSRVQFVDQLVKEVVDSLGTIQVRPPVVVDVVDVVSVLVVWCVPAVYLTSFDPDRCWNVDLDDGVFSLFDLGGDIAMYHDL